MQRPLHPHHWKQTSCSSREAHILKLTYNVHDFFPREASQKFKGHTEQVYMFSIKHGEGIENAGPA